MLSISVLGPVSVTHGDTPRRIPGGKTAELLVRLAVEPGGMVRAERLLDDLWADGAARTTLNTLQSKVAKLRRALGDPALLVSRDGTYRLVIEPGQIDVFAALDASASARKLLDAGQAHEAAELSGSSLGLFDGELLPGAGDAPWVEPHRARLSVARVELVAAWCEARLRLGDTSVVADLELALADHPFEEALWGLLITAHYRAGRQADALAAYRRIRTTLGEELGLDPGPELQALERQILAQDERLASVRAAVAIDQELPAGNLPPLAVRLLGRDGDLAAVTERLGESRLVEIVGPGGVGKTALAIEVGRVSSWRGGSWLVRLDGAGSAVDIEDATVAALGVTGGVAALVERLRTMETLLVVDNCEHVLDAAASWVTRLLEAAPAVRILCTSQARLDLDGSTVYELAPLALAAAVELFTERALATRPRSVAGGEAGGEAGVRTLCAALDGLPLAIELAAARTRTLSIEEITRRLDDRFVVLSDPSSRRPERRRALRATVAWSYDLLFPDDQRGLWALATFADSAALGAVEVVLSSLGVPSDATIDVLSRLAARSLVIVDDGVRGARYRLLDSIRAFALEAMHAAGEAEVARAAHARWYAAAAQESTDGVRGAAQADHLAFVREERANIDAALFWLVAHDPLEALATVCGFGWAWVVLGDSRGAQRLLTAIDAADEMASPTRRAEALLLAGWIEASTGHLEPARRHVLEATGIADDLGDVELQARAAYYLAYIVSHNGDFREGLALTDRSRMLYAELDRPWDLAANALFATRAAISAGDEARSVELVAEVQHWLSMVDDPWFHARSEAQLGELARLQHRFDDAVDHIARAAATSHRLGFRQTEAYQVASLGRAQCQAGDIEGGAATLALAVGKAEAIGDVRMAALARVHLGRVLRGLDRAAEARSALEHAAAWHRRAGGGEQALLGECLLAALDAADGDSGAVGRLREVRGETPDDAPVQVFALDALARAAALAGDADVARALVAEADGRMAAASHFISDRDRVDRRATTALLGS